MFIDSSLGWFDVSRPPLYPLHTVHLNQMMPSVSVDFVIYHTDYLHVLKIWSTRISCSLYLSPISEPVLVLVFFDPAIRTDSGHIPFPGRLFVGKFWHLSRIKTPSNSGHNLEPPVVWFVRWESSRELRSLTKERCWSFFFSILLKKKSC